MTHLERQININPFAFSPKKRKKITPSAKAFISNDSPLSKSQIRQSSCRLWIKYLRNDALKQVVTGHKDIPNFGFIYMNARIYDPEIGRFLSADTIVQDPYDPQTYNRYSYVRNNPLTLIDPTGHSFLSKKWKQFKSTIIGGTVAFFTGGLGASAFWAGAFGGASGAAITGGNIWKGALTGGISASAFQWAGHGKSGLKSFGGAEAFRRHVAFGAASGGINSVINGGKFGEGFVSGGLSAGIAKRFGGNGIGSRAILGGIGGGIASKIYGGSFNDGFSSGASTGAFAYIFNDYWAKRIHERAYQNRNNIRSLTPEERSLHVLGGALTIALGSTLVSPGLGLAVGGYGAFQMFEGGVGADYTPNSMYLDAIIASVSTGKAIETIASKSASGLAISGSVLSYSMDAVSNIPYMRSTINDTSYLIRDIKTLYRQNKIYRSNYAENNKHRIYRGTHQYRIR